MRTPEEKRAVAKALLHVVEDKRCAMAREVIAQAFELLQISPEEGEAILAMILGTSLGARQQSIPGSAAMGILALVWMKTVDLDDNEGDEAMR